MQASHSNQHCNDWKKYLWISIRDCGTNNGMPIGYVLHCIPTHFFRRIRRRRILQAKGDFGDVSPEPFVHRLNAGTQRPRNPQAVTEPGSTTTIAAPTSRPTPRIHSPVRRRHIGFFTALVAAVRWKSTATMLDDHSSLFLGGGRWQETSPAARLDRPATRKLNVVTTAQWSRSSAQIRREWLSWQHSQLDSICLHQQPTTLSVTNRHKIYYRLNLWRLYLHSAIKSCYSLFWQCQNNSRKKFSAAVFLSFQS